MNYTFKAFDSTGHITEGQLSAESYEQAFLKLKKLKISPISLTKTDEIKFKKSLGFFKTKKITKFDISNFTTRLTALTKAKMPLAKALHSIREQSEKETLKNLVSDISEKISSGASLSDVLAEYPKYFSKLYVNLIKIGEAGGILEQSLLRISEIRKRDQEIVSTLKSALTYPAIMFLVMIASIAVLITFVIPNFTHAFGDMGMVLPLPTRILIFFSNAIINFWWIFFIIIGFGIFLLITFLKKDQGKLAFDKFKLTIPVIGTLIHEIALSRFMLSLGSLLKGGVTLVKGIEATAEITANRYLTESLSSILKEVREGESLSTTFKKRTFFFTNLAIEMTQTGEESGNLDDMLESVGNYYAGETELKIKTLTTLFEPLMIIVMGIIVGFIVMAMILPIFQISTSIR